MSLRAFVLNHLLKLAERPRLARGTPEELRSSVEARARVMFRPSPDTDVRDIVLGDLPALRVADREADPSKVIYYIHGGAFVFASPSVYRAMLGRLSALTGWEAVLPNYRKAPEHPFPAAADDVRAGWEALLSRGHQPGDIVVGGDSAGGNLALVMLADLVADGAQLPRGVFALSPVTDLTYSSPSVQENAARDSILPAERAIELRQMYLQGHDPEDPRASPIGGRFQGAPPVFIAASTTEMLRDDGLRMVDHLEQADVNVTLHTGDGLPHVWPLFRPFIPEAEHTLQRIAKWITALPETTDES